MEVSSMEVSDGVNGVNGTSFNSEKQRHGGTYQHYAADAAALARRAIDRRVWIASRIANDRAACSPGASVDRAGIGSKPYNSSPSLCVSVFELVPLPPSPRPPTNL